MILHAATAVLIAVGMVVAFAAYVASFGCLVRLVEGDKRPSVLTCVGAFYAVSPILFCLFMAGWTATS